MNWKVIYLEKIRDLLHYVYWRGRRNLRFITLCILKRKEKFEIYYTMYIEEKGEIWDLLHCVYWREKWVKAQTLSINC